MASVPAADLLLVARDRIGFYDVARRFNAARVEVRLDNRHGERRRAASPSTGDERRRRDRRGLDVTEQLLTTGWVLISAEDRTRHLL